jgi:CDGSH-type Zn-finger protein
VAVLTPLPDGPMLAVGNLRVHRADGSVAFEGRVARLCRCGKSADKPLCDDSHLRVGFREPGAIVEDRMKPDDAPPAPGDDLVTFSPKPDGSLHVRGRVEVRGTDGKVCSGTFCKLCRCGASKAMPFSDGTHKTIGFRDPDSTD